MRSKLCLFEQSLLGLCLMIKFIYSSCCFVAHHIIQETQYGPFLHRPDSAIFVQIQIYRIKICFSLNFKLISIFSRNSFNNLQDRSNNCFHCLATLFSPCSDESKGLVKHDRLALALNMLTSRSSANDMLMLDHKLCFLVFILASSVLLFS